ncbi:MAG: radical SAM protein, partial [Planctomycetota bacterium]
MIPKPKIVLIYPKLHGEGVEEQANFPPLALLAAARKVNRERYDVRIVDLRFENEFERGAERLLADCVCVGVSALSGHQIASGLDACRVVRQKAPGVPIVWGGWHPTLFPEETAAHPLVDVVVRGQGETTFSELVDSFDRRRPIHHIEGISFQSNGSVQHNTDRPIADISDFPPMPYDLVDVNRYLSPDGNGGERFIYYISSAGCPHRCGFCVISLVYNRRWYALPAERVVNEIESLVGRYGIRTIEFADSELFVGKKRVLEICRLLVERKLDVKWVALLRTEALKNYDDEELDLLKRSGCKRLVFGVETGSQRMSDLICKDNRVEDAIESAKKLKKTGIEGHFAFVFGFPGEAREDVKASFRLIAKLKEIAPESLVPMYFYHPDPQTPLYRKALEMGLVAPGGLEGWGKVDYNIKEAWAPWITPRFT